jgi:CBS domain-containing protein
MPRVSEIMTHDVFTTTPTASVAEVASEMVRGRIGSALVMEGGWLAGIFTERDALRAAASGNDLKAASISEWMTAEPVTTSPDAESEEAAQMMAAHGFRHLPVMDDNQVVGIVSLRDVMAARIGRPQPR